MPDSVQITSNAAEVLRAFNRFPKTVQTGIIAGVARALLIVETRVRVRSRATTAGSVKFSGARAGLSSRLTSFARAQGEMGFEAAIGFRRTRGFPYELSQEFGARAKPGKAISISITPEARSAGSPRNFPAPLFLVKRHKNALLMGKGLTGLMPQYVLVKSLKPRLKFRETVQQSADLISSEIVKGADDAIRNI